MKKRLRKRKFIKAERKRIIVFNISHIPSLRKNKYTKKPRISGLFWENMFRLFCNRFRLLLTSIELINRTSLEDTFFSSIKRVAMIAWLNFDFSCNRTSCYKCVSARTKNGCLCREFWVDIFHRFKKVNKMYIWAIVYEEVCFLQLFHRFL